MYIIDRIPATFFFRGLKPIRFLRPYRFKTAKFYLYDMKHFLIALAALTTSFTAMGQLEIRAQSVKIDTVSIHSNAMGRTFKCVVISPEFYKGESGSPRLGVVYLLHGYSGGYDNWIKRVPKLAMYARDFNLIIVCPDGGYSGWYFDSPVEAGHRYETYIGKEVPDFIDSAYSTIKSREARAITGLSMGGHGGLFLGFRHADRFGACGSMSGAVDINTLRKSYDIAKLIGDTVKYEENWTKYSVSNVIEQYPKDSVKIIIDCGVEDFFYPINHALHEKMLRLKIPHDYIERPGKHDWAYWANAVKYQLLFFRDYFYNRK
jgi:S-formylglutathione hydrolase FrmB